MLRRPPGQVATPRKCLLALTFIFLPWLVDAQQQHPREPLQVRSPPEDDHHVASNIAATPLTPLTGQQVVETPRIHARRKNTISGEGADDNAHGRLRPVSRSADTVFIPEDASGHALAPDLSVRAAPPSAYRSSSNGVGLSQQIARRLEDWEVEDYVLLATVDGDLYASDRTTGHERWHYKADQPMVETTHFRTNRSELDEDYNAIDHFIWVVEPTRDGELYLWRSTESGPSLTKMPLTIKKVVEGAPWNDVENGLVWTGDKKTTLVTLNAATGTVIKEFGSTGTYVNQMESCLKPNAIADGVDEECTDGGTISLGRTEYTVVIHGATGPIARLKYSEWGPNNRDNDLIQQNIVTKDNRYVTGQHDGKVYGFDYARFREERPLFTQKLSSPVARVFDVLQRCPSPGADPDLIVLPQPPIPAGDEDSMRRRSENVFINQTEAGSWYALSGSRYPLVLHAPLAPIRTREWWSLQGPDLAIDEAFMSKAMVGVHQLPDGHGIVDDKEPNMNIPLTIDAPQHPDGVNSSPKEHESGLPAFPTVLNSATDFAWGKIFDLFTNPFAVVAMLFFMWVYKEKIPRFWRKSLGWKQLDTSAIAPRIEVSSTVPNPQPIPEAPVVPDDIEEKEATAEPDLVPPVAPKEPSLVPEPAGKEPASKEPASKEPSPVLTPEPADPEKSPSDNPDGGALAENGKKKKAHRGRRGGVKHKKPNTNKDKREGSQSRDDDPPQATVDEVVNKAKQLGAEPKLEPDILTVPNGVEEVSGPILKMGSLEVNEEQQLGTGSNGTVVFAGKWDGRDVAVKRMLVQFNEIASQETRLLRESDDHPNVIRYFAQQQRAAFLYIALELCQASLADIIQKPAQFRELAQAGERDMPNVLYQVTNGLSHLHSLRIVHRDLKPQNILVNMGKDGRPRLLVSDFGLCKKLEGGQSSFGATTAHAAGTSGWRAPELLLDDDGPINTSMTLDPHSSLHSASGSGVVGAELMGPNHRRVTRAIDIFSLGLVFYYVLSRGFHPFDCGDRYMREVNIRKGKYNLEHLDNLGEYKQEAHDLIASMLNSNPKERPSAREVMAHPFFWTPKKRLSFLCDVSDHFEKEPRDPPSEALRELEYWAPQVIAKGDFLKTLDKEFVDSLGKQRKYTGGRMLDLLRALRNKRNHYEDMSESLRKMVGPLPEGYLCYWTSRFPDLLITCWNVVYTVGWDDTDRFREYYQPARL